MDWFNRGRGEFDFYRISWKDLTEIGRIDAIKPGGSLKFNLNTALKQSGQITAHKLDDMGNDLIRVYYTGYDRNGESERVALATLFAVTPKRSISGTKISGEIDLLSPLTVLDDDQLDSYLTVRAGTFAVAYAADMCQRVGLQVNHDVSDARLQRDWVFEPGTSKLKVVNELLAFAGFMSADLDGYGVVQLRRYQSIENVSPIVTFKDDSNSVIVKESIEDEYDWYNTPNKVICVVSDEKSPMTATATNTDALSPFSIQNRRRTITRYEEFNDIETQAALQAKADYLLETSTKSARSVTFSHGYVPMMLGDIHRIDHTSIDFTGSVQEFDIKLTPSMETQTRIRRFE